MIEIRYPEVLAAILSRHTRNLRARPTRDSASGRALDRVWDSSWFTEYYPPRLVIRSLR